MVLWDCGREARECGQAVGNASALSRGCPHAPQGSRRSEGLVHSSTGPSTRSARGPDAHGELGSTPRPLVQRNALRRSAVRILCSLTVGLARVRVAIGWTARGLVDAQVVGLARVRVAIGRR